MPGRSTAPLEGLPAELLLVVLENLESPIDFENVLDASIHVSQIFHADASQITLSRFLHRAFDQRLLRLAVDILYHPELSEIPDVRERALVAMDYHFQAYARAGSSPQPLPVAHVFNLLWEVDNAVFDYFSSAVFLYESVQGEQGSAKMEWRPSPSELHRLRRGFLRFELCSHSWQRELIKPPSRAGLHLPGREFHWLRATRRIRDWEVEEIACAYAYVKERYSQLLDSIHREYLDEIQETAMESEKSSEGRAPYPYAESGFLHDSFRLSATGRLERCARAGKRVWTRRSVDAQVRRRADQISNTRNALTGNLASAGLQMLRRFRQGRSWEQQKRLVLRLQRPFSRGFGVQRRSPFMELDLQAHHGRTWALPLPETGPEEALRERGDNPDLPNLAFKMRRLLAPHAGPRQYVVGGSGFVMKPERMLGWVFWDADRLMSGSTLFGLDRDGLKEAAPWLFRPDDGIRMVKLTRLARGRLLRQFRRRRLGDRYGPTWTPRQILVEELEKERQTFEPGK